MNLLSNSWRLLWASLLVVCPVIWADQMQPLSIDWLGAKAQLVVRGTVLSKAVQRDPAGRIYTAVQLQVAEIWKGSLATNRCTIVHAGGVLGDQAAVVSGEARYEVGEEIVAFLVLNQRGEGVSIGLSQGKFEVFRDRDTGEKLARNRFHGREGGTPKASAAQPDEAGVLRRLTVVDLKSRAQGGRH